jgi:O-antigen/teichoic acid export membrane protein
MPSRSKRAISPLLKNSAWNIIALIIPSLIGIPAMGFMARRISVEMFGLFLVVYAILGYSNIFDVGLTRSVIREVSIHRRDEQKVRLIVGTASCAVLMMGSIASGVLWVIANPLAGYLNATQSAHLELVWALRWTSVGIPFFLLTYVWLSYFEGNEQFAKLSVIKSITNSLLVLLPAVALLVRPRLESAIVGLILARVIAMAITYLQYRKPNYKVWCFDVKELIGLWKFGGWITISNIVSPVLVYFDRFILSNLAGAQSVAFYTAPSEAIARISVVPNAVSRSLFPRLNNSATDSTQQASLAFLTLLISSIVIGTPIFIFSKLIMTTWMGPEYGGSAAVALRILIIGFLLNALAQVPFAEIQAQGDSKITAILHVVEVIPYLLLLFFLARSYSVVGAAVAWTIRNGADYMLLQVISLKRRKMAVSNALS